MPKMSADYLAGRREHILNAARCCFARNGFHATSMQDLFEESGVSAGAVYRYFASKDEVILAIAEAGMKQIIAAIAEVAGGHPDASLGDALAVALELIDAKDEADGLCSLAVQVWSEALRNPALAARFTESLHASRAELVAVVAAHQNAGRLPTDVDAAALVTVLTSVLPGYILQRALLGPDVVRGAGAAVRALWPATAAATAPRCE